MIKTSYEARLFADRRITLDEKISRLEQYTRDYNTYNSNFFRLGAIIAQLAIDYPTDRRVINTYATHLIASGNDTEAMEYLRRHLDDQEATAEEYITVMQYEIFMNERELLITDLQRALERYPNDINILSFSAFLANENNDYDLALEIFRQALRHTSSKEERSMLWGYMGDVYNEMGLMSKCFKAYDKALRYNEQNIAVLNNYAYFLAIDGGNLQKAFTMAQQAIAIEPGNYTYLDTYAWILHLLGRDKEAKSIMQQALSLSSQRDADLLAHYGDILWSLGEYYVAESYWDKAIKQGFDADKMEQHRKSIKEETNRR